MTLALSSAVSSAAGAIVDGISDQNLAEWQYGFTGAAFGGFFRSTWAGEPPAHVRYARFVVQWDAASEAGREPYAHYLSQFEAWYADVRSIGLIPDVAFGSYAGPPPGSAGSYERALSDLLSRYPAPIVEAWNEPNHTPGLPVDRAAAFMDDAYSYCRAHGCTAIAGDVLDTPGSATYLREYRAALSPSEYPRPRDPGDWGVHPYEAVNRAGGEALAIAHELAPGDRLWVTEVGAYYCELGHPSSEFGEATQAKAARRLIESVIPQLHPVHVFYDYFMFKDGLETPCERYSDSALYDSAGEPRAAAAIIFGGSPGPPFVFAGDADGGLAPLL